MATENYVYIHVSKLPFNLKLKFIFVKVKCRKVPLANNSTTCALIFTQNKSLIALQNSL